MSSRGALGFESRSHIQNNGGRLLIDCSSPHRKCGYVLGKTAQLIDFSPNWVFWHHWPDSKVHDGSGAGQGLEMLTRDVAQQLSSDDFWTFVERLAKGRRLVITSDHGYAATGYFSDADGEVGAIPQENIRERAQQNRTR